MLVTFPHCKEHNLDSAAAAAAVLSSIFLFFCNNKEENKYFCRYNIHISDDLSRVYLCQFSLSLLPHPHTTHPPHLWYSLRWFLVVWQPQALFLSLLLVGLVGWLAWPLSDRSDGVWGFEKRQPKWFWFPHLAKRSAKIRIVSKKMYVWLWSAKKSVTMQQKRIVLLFIYILSDE